MASVFGGLRVVELGQGMAVPVAGGIMADHGAEVIKVEPPGGDWARSRPGFHTWNRGKHSLVLDLGTDAGRDVARAVARSADVVLEGLGPGRAEEMGLDGVALGADCPHLVHCSVTAFGLATALGDVPADDALVAAASGRMLGAGALSGAEGPDAEERPVYLAAPVSSFGAAMLALEAVTAGLFDRARTGRGRRLETSLLDGATAATPRLRLERDGDDLWPRGGRRDLVAVDDARPDPGGPVGPLVAMSETPARIQGPAPELGRDGIRSGPARYRPVPPGWPGPRGRLGARDRSVARGRLVAASHPSPLPSPRPLPLAGVTVVELASSVAGSLGPALLAELGARVIKVEPPGGDPQRRMGLEFAHLATGKESIVVDLAQPEGAEVLAGLVRSADVVVHDMRPAVAAGLGLGHEDLVRLNPSLVDVVADSDSDSDASPDPCAGMAVAAAVTMGLLARERWGVGQRLEVSTRATAGYVCSDAPVRYPGGPEPARPDAGRHGLCARYRLYECRRGWLFLAAPREQTWPALVEALGAVEWPVDARFATAEARRAHDDELAGEIGHRLGTRSATEWEAILRLHRVAATVADGPGFEELLVDQGLVRPREHEELGSYWGLLPRVRVPGSSPPREEPCGCGEHTGEVLAGLGYDGAARAALVAGGVVAEARNTFDSCVDIKV